MDVNKLPRFLQLGGQVAAFFMALKGFSYFYEFLVFPAIMIWLGDSWGILVMTAAGTALNLIFILFYDWTEAEIVDEIREFMKRPAKTKVGTLLGKITNNRVGMFLLLSWEDPLYAIFYFRKGGRHGKSLEGSDWAIFIASNVMANFVWGSVVSTGLWLSSLFF